MTRYFVDCPLEQEVELSDEKIFHHLTKVLRVQVGERLILVNAVAVIYQIVEINSQFIKCQLIAPEMIKREVNTQLTLAVPLLKKDNLELVLQKATELGVSKFLFLQTTNTVVKYDRKKFLQKNKRYQDIITSAAQQSQRNVIPVIENYTTLQQIDFSQYDLVLCAHEQENNNLLYDVDLTYHNILIIIGPEGGFTAAEIDFLREQGVVSVSLGTRILRAETAAITMVSNILMLKGDV